MDSPDHKQSTNRPRRGRFIAEPDLDAAREMTLLPSNATEDEIQRFCDLLNTASGKDEEPRASSDSGKSESPKDSPS